MPVSTYEWADSLINASPRYETGFTELLATKPYQMSSNVRRLYESRDGKCISIEDFSRWPRAQQSYYLKYAGSDWTLNWGSKAVYSLGNMGSNACLDFLRQCLSQYERGRIWLLQQEETQNDEILYETRDGELLTARRRAKFCGFYGPGGCLGVMVMHSRHNKVHGQPDTVLSYVLAEDEDRITA